MDLFSMSLSYAFQLTVTSLIIKLSGANRPKR